MKRTVFFDLGNVLIFFSYSRMLLQLSKCTGLLPEVVHHLLEDQKLRDSYEIGTVTSDELYHRFLQAATHTFSSDDFFHAASDIFVPNEPIYPILFTLKQAGIPLLLLSNTNPAHFDFLSKRYTFLNLFDKKILSYQVGAAKPDPAIYTAALESAGCPPADCFYIDDLPPFVEGARQAGIDAEQYTDISSLKKHLSSRGLL